MERGEQDHADHPQMVVRHVGLVHSGHPALLQIVAVCVAGYNTA